MFLLAEDFVLSKPPPPNQHNSDSDEGGGLVVVVLAKWLAGVLVWVVWW